MKHRPKALPGIRTAPYPGFPTDLQSPLMAVCARADGQKQDMETVFESRFRTAQELQKMGAEIFVQGNLATTKESAAACRFTARAPDLREARRLLWRPSLRKGSARSPDWNIFRGAMRISEQICAFWGRRSETRRPETR
ncbi:MAG: hypothetical protein ACLTSZ_08645 [Lachnospiraceae bacterium]